MNATVARDFAPPDLAAAIAEFGDRLRDPWWRISSGKLYRIMTKDTEDEPGSVMPFIPNPEQAEFLQSLWYRNICLKARQLGFTTATAIYFLDHALWNADQRCGIIAHRDADAEAIFRDKVLFAYNSLPLSLRIAFPLQARRADELLFAHNNSAIRVSTSMRSGTIHRLHVSEMGKMAVQFPARAKEVISGSLPAVPTNGCVIVESTAEGADGVFYEMAAKSEAIHQEGRPLNPLEFRFHFFAWWRHRPYRMNPQFVTITPQDHVYFDEVEGNMGCTIDLWQRAWYVATRDGAFSGNQELMWREHPSTPAECWQQSTEGTFYGPQLAQARGKGRIKDLPVVPNVPVNTFWDIGSTDGTGIWFHQYLHPNHHLIRYIEGWGESYSYFINQMTEFGYLWGTHYLPHDVENERQGETTVYTPLSVLQKLKPGWRFEVVPRVDELIHGIQATRDLFPLLWFDRTLCKEGLDHLANYRKRLVTQTGAYSDQPLKNGHTEAADALRQLAQALETLNLTVSAGSVPRRHGARRRTA